jgi:hypothetical protein
MISFLIENDDLVFNEQNELKMITGNDEKAQSIQRTMTTNLKEFFLNERFGFDYRILQQKTINKNYLRMGINDAVTIDPDIKSIDNLTVSGPTPERTASIIFRVLLKDGTSIESEVTA